MTDDTQDIVARLRRAPNMTLPMGAMWTMAEQAADLIEAQAAEIERLGRELNKAKYGDPVFAWEAHQAAMDAMLSDVEIDVFARIEGEKP